MSSGRDRDVDFAAALNKRWWAKPTVWVSAVSMAVSCAALVIAIRGSFIAGASLELSARQFAAERQPIWLASPDERHESLVIKPLDPSMALQSATVIYPKAVSNQEWGILPPDFRVFVVSPAFDLAAVIGKSLPTKQAYTQLSLGAHLPVVIASHYAVKGEGFVDHSLYALTYDFVVSETPHNPVSVKFTGMEFVRRLEPSENERQVVEEAWSKFGLPSPATTTPGAQKPVA